MIDLSYNGKVYNNVVELANELPILTSKLIGWYDGAEVICANAGGICYETIVSEYQSGKWVLNKRGEKVLEHSLKSRHNSVLEHGVATFLKKVPIFVARQDLRARIATFNERSLRYVRLSDGSLTYYTPRYLTSEYIEKLQQKGERQKAEYLINLAKQWHEVHKQAIDLYSKYTDDELNYLIDEDSERIRETLRAVLPLGINTVYIDTRNLWSWTHHLEKRLCLRAQEEIRLIKEQELNQLKSVFSQIFQYVNRPCLTHVGCNESKNCRKMTKKAN